MKLIHKILLFIILIGYFVMSFSNIQHVNSIANNNNEIIIINKEIQKFRKNSDKLSSLYYEKSIIYDKKLNRLKALEFAQKALEQSRESKNKRIECKSLQHLAVLLIDLKNKNNNISQIRKDRISVYLKQSEKLAFEINDSQILAQYYVYKGLFENKTHHYNKSNIAFKKAIGYEKNNEIKKITYTALDNISGNYYFLKEYEKSLLYTKKAFSYFKKEDKKASIYNSLGVSYYMLENDDSALYYYKKAIKHAILEKNIEVELHVLKNLANYYSNAVDKDFEKSAEYFESYIELKDSVDGINKNKIFLEMQEKYNTRENELKLEKSKSETLFQKRQKTGYLIFFLLTVSALTFVLRSLMHKRKLAVSEKKLATQQLENIIKNQETSNYDAMIEGQEKERQRIAADLHDGLGSKLSTVKLYFGAMEDTIKNPVAKTQFLKAQNLLDLSVQEIRKISKNISDNTLNKFGLLGASKELQKVIENSGKLKINIFNIGLDGRMNNNIEVNVFKILQELLNNIIKHASAKKVDISFTQNGNDFTMIVEDDGIGFDLLKVRDGGSGIKNLKNRLKKINGNIEYDSIKQKGTTVIVNVNLDKYA